MSKRTTEETAYWNKSIKDMFTADPKTVLLKNRVRAIRYLLKPRYTEQTFADKDKTIAMIIDTVYLDRKLRLLTEGKEKKLKKHLSDKFVVEELGYGH